MPTVKETRKIVTDAAYAAAEDWLERGGTRWINKRVHQRLDEAVEVVIGVMTGLSQDHRGYWKIKQPLRTNEKGTYLYERLKETCETEVNEWIETFLEKLELSEEFVLTQAKHFFVAEFKRQLEHRLRKMASAKAEAILEKHYKEIVEEVLDE